MAICSPAYVRRGIGKALLQYVDAAHKAPTENRGFSGKCSGFAAVPINGIFICGLVLEKCREMNPPSDGLLYGKTIKGRFEASFYCSIRFI